MESPKVFGYLYYKDNAITLIGVVYNLTDTSDAVNTAKHAFIWGWARYAGWNMSDLDAVKISSMGQIYTHGSLEGELSLVSGTPVTVYGLAGTIAGMAVAGIDKPIGLQGGTLLIYQALLDGPIDIYNARDAGQIVFSGNTGNGLLSAGAGKSVLTVAFFYTGDLGALFNGAFHKDHIFYITDTVDGVSASEAGWQKIAYTASTYNTAMVGFYVTPNAGPYVLHDSLDNWTIDLSSQLNKP